jgi:hypothetical protein
MKQVETIIEQLIGNPDDGQLANRLLGKFHQGAPLELLLPLLLSPDADLASSAAWIASELGQGGKSLLDIMAKLSEHPDRRVRFWVIDCILLWAGPANQYELSKAAQLIDDPDKAVRWKALTFLSRASRDQLQGALAGVVRDETESPYVRGLQWLLSDEGQDAEAVEGMLHNADPRMRKYAAVAAVRLAPQTRHPITVAASLDDLEIAEFVADVL